MDKPMRISSDDDLNPALADQVSGLRGGMVGAAERFPVPDRFTFEPQPDAPRMTLTDSETGRTTDVSLCDYLGVRKALQGLFGQAA